ncbi:alpha amylase [Mycoplasmopsis canis UFG4]|uniref:Alpha amylase n=1 Tax=Mycoplasmopsis canis UFG4 TaxID=1131455 RepID=I1A780_9BACT|nr:alpha-amylase family glycosyl hydrolase [Mycoplasmopsis canis]EIE42351.1 alpha amylase [Mycoplasmopsis canis UFG4]
MNLVKKDTNFFKEFDAKFAYKKGDLGASFLGKNIQVKLWQPLAKKVELILFKKHNDTDPFAKLEMQKEEVTNSKGNKTFLWKIEIKAMDYRNAFYQFLITHENGEKTAALDPYAKSMAPFNWEGHEDRVGKGAFVDLKSSRAGKKPRDLKTKWNNSVDANIYEMHVRDFTSLLKNTSFHKRKASFRNLIDAGIFKYLKDLNITHLQLLPIHSAYTVNDKNKKIFKKGEGQGWTTNYNWGYDPHNYFTINGLYSSKPSNPYSRIKDFKEFVDEAHKHGIGIIVDVVYNHMMTNSSYDNILPGYYYRDNAEVRPVSYAPLADEREMTKKIMVDSLKHFVNEFNVDGFRFDLSCFHHKETIDEISNELRNINPNIILHGEAWPFSDLKFEDSYIKGATGNDVKFGYFNDTLRDAIKGSEHEGYHKGLIHEYSEEHFKKYVTSVVAGLRDYDFKDVPHANSKYDLFNNDVAVNLSYAACHDGMTLWDKINIFAENKSFIERIEMYRQGLMMTILTQGRQLVLAGTELLQSKPCDMSGEEGFKCQVSAYDDFNEKPDNNAFSPNSYKTTDYTNGIKWSHLDKKEVKEYVFKFFSQLNKFRQTTDYLRLDSNEKVFERIKFEYHDIKNGILIYSIQNNDNTKEMLALHNFGDKDFDSSKFMGNLLFDSKIQSLKNILQAHSTQIIEREK